MKKMNIILPESWAELTDKQLLMVYGLFASDLSTAEVKHPSLDYSQSPRSSRFSSSCSSAMSIIHSIRCHTIQLITLQSTMEVECIVFLCKIAFCSISIMSKTPFLQYLPFRPGIQDMFYHPKYEYYRCRIVDIIGQPHFCRMVQHRQ